MKHHVALVRCFFADALYLAARVKRNKMYSILYSSGSQPVGRDPKVGRGGVSVGSRTAASIVC